MKKFANVLLLTLLCVSAAQAHALNLNNRSGGTLCVSETRDEPDPFDHDVARITTGWTCFDNFSSLTLDHSDGILDIVIKKVDGTDYVATSCLAFEKTKIFAPKDISIGDFGMEILKLSSGGVVYTWYFGSSAQWSRYQSVRTIEDLPPKLDALGFKQFEAWQIDSKQSGLSYNLW